MKGFLTAILIGCLFLRTGEAALSSETLRSEAERSLREHNYLRAASLSLLLTREAQATDGGALNEMMWLDLQRLGVAFRELGDFTQSRTVLGQALKRASSSVQPTLRFELLKTLYFENTPASLEEAFQQYQQLPGDFSRKVGFLNSTDAWEAGYLGALVALKTRRLDQAMTLANALPPNSDFGFLAQEAVARAMSHGKPETIRERFLKGYAPKSVEARDALDLVRLLQAETWIEKGDAARADEILRSVPHTSRYYQNALLGRAWAITRKPTVAESSSLPDITEALAYLKRAREAQPLHVQAVQAFLLSSSLYQRVGAYERARESLKQGLGRLEEMGSLYGRIEHPQTGGRFLNEAIALYQKPAKTGSKEALLILQTEAAFQGIPKISRLRRMANGLGEQHARLAKFLLLLERPDFDPHLLRAGNEEVRQVLLSPELVEKAHLSRNVRQAYDAVQDRLLLFELTKRYSQYLIEERRWQNLSQLLVEKAITEKMKHAEQVTSMQRAIREYYLSDHLGKKTEAIAFLEEKVSDLDKSLFLEDRVVSQSELLTAGVLHEDQRLKQLEALLRVSPDRFIQSEILEMKRLRMDMDFWLSRIKQMERVFKYDRDAKRFRALTEMMVQYTDNPELRHMQEEIDRIRNFLDAIQKGDEEAQRALFETLWRMQRTLSHSARMLMRHILAVIGRDLMARQEIARAQLGSLEERLRGRLAGEIGRELVQRRVMEDRYRALLQFELAKVLDQKSYKQ